MYNAQVKFSNTHITLRTQMAGQRLTTDTTGGVDEIIFSVLPWYKLNHLKTLHLIWIDLSAQDITDLRFHYPRSPLLPVCAQPQ